jgi:glucokinase
VNEALAGPYSLGIDLGASKANIGVLDAAGEVVRKSRLDVREAKGNRVETIELIFKEAERILLGLGLGLGDLGFIGMGVPGTVDPEGRRVLLAPNLGWKDFGVHDLVRERFKVHVRLIQDGSAAALAEYLLGAGRGEPVLVCVTLGTGIGCGIIIGGKVYGGAFKTAGEIGHVVVEEDGIQCGCGQRGCLEAYASGTAIMKAAGVLEGRDRIDGARMVFDRARAGDGGAARIIRDAAAYLGVALVNVVNMLSPNAVIISGGMCEQEELLLRPVRDYVMRRAYPLAIPGGSFRVAKASLGEDAPMIGAGSLYKGV